MRLRGLLDYLGEVASDEEVVLSNYGVDPVQKVFALEEDSTACAGVNIYDTLERVTLCVQTETSIFIDSVGTIVEEDDQCELAELSAMFFVIRVADVGVLVFVIPLFSSGSAIETLKLNIFVVNAKRSVARAFLACTVEL